MNPSQIEYIDNPHLDEGWVVTFYCCHHKVQRSFRTQDEAREFHFKIQTIALGKKTMPLVVGHFRYMRNKES